MAAQRSSSRSTTTAPRPRRKTRGESPDGWRPDAAAAGLERAFVAVSGSVPPGASVGPVLSERSREASGGGASGGGSSGSEATGGEVGGEGEDAEAPVAPSDDAAPDDAPSDDAPRDSALSAETRSGADPEGGSPEGPSVFPGAACVRARDGRMLRKDSRRARSGIRAMGNCPDTSRPAVAPSVSPRASRSSWRADALSAAIASMTTRPFRTCIPPAVRGASGSARRPPVDADAWYRW
jgi:hypothetical protein